MRLDRWPVVLAACAGALLPLQQARASSHSEAPMIAQDPQADNTDVYFFRSPEDPSKVVILANYIPMEEPSAGPSYKYFADSVRYEIHVDRNQDGRDDLSFYFRFKTHTRVPGTLLPYLGPITRLTTDGKTTATDANIDPNYNRYQAYSVTMVRHRGGKGGDEGKSTLLADNVIVPPNNAGSSTTPDFGALTEQAIHSIRHLGIRTFAGQVDDPFYLDLGAIFDLLRVRPYRSLHALNGAIPLPDRAAAPDMLAGFNTHAIALEIPITFLTGTSTIPGANDPRRILGVYAGASRRRVTVLRERAARDSGRWVQISRLGAPLVNELFMPIADAKGLTRDYWNRTEPEADRQFRRFFQFPEVTLRLAQLYPALRSVLPNIKYDANENPVGFTGPRSDFLGAVTPLLNFAPDFLRLDVSVPPNPTPNRLGALGGDVQGFPNGRRLGDDVVDIYMRAAAGALLNGDTAAFLESIHFGDGVDAHENGRVSFRSAFPFTAFAHGGVNPAHIGFPDEEAAAGP
jgi:hypothetical protein